MNRTTVRKTFSVLMFIAVILTTYSGWMSPMHSAYDGSLVMPGVEGFILMIGFDILIGAVLFVLYTNGGDE
jgi:hypothetical protein